MGRIIKNLYINMLYFSSHYLDMKKNVLKIKFSSYFEFLLLLVVLQRVSTVYRHINLERFLVLKY